MSAREVSIEELRNDTAGVIRAVARGERITLTQHGAPVADVVAHGERRSPWVPAAELRRIRSGAPADAGLLADLAAIRDDRISEP